MKTAFGLQITSRDDSELQMTANSITAAGLPFVTFGVIPFTYEITNLEAFEGLDRVLPLCGTKVLDMYLRPGTLPPEWDLYYSPELCDQKMYSTHLRKHMVNSDATFYMMRNIQHRKFHYPMFVKPSNDMKAFAGFVLEANTSIAEALAKTTHQKIDPDEAILLADVKPVTNEYRVFVVNNKVVGASQYRNANGVHKWRIEGKWLQRLVDYHESLQIDAPHPYVVDFVQYADKPGFAVMEFNCFNCSGMYAVNRVAIFRAVADWEGM